MNLTLRRIVFLAAQATACVAAYLGYGLPGAQWCLFAIAVAWLCFRLFFILDLIARLLIGNVLLVALVAGFYAALSGLTASSYGVMNLFWHENLATRMAAAFFSTLFFSLMFLAAFYADPDKEDTQDRLKDYLRNDATLGDLVRVAFRWVGATLRSLWKWFRGKGWERPSRVVARPPVDVDDPGEPSVQDYIKRFLAVFFYPFWWVLMLPAVAPVAYPYVPRTVPTRLFGKSDWIAPADNNVETHAVAWLAGLLIWGLGVYAGRFSIWAYVEINRRLYGVLDARLRDDPTLRSHFDAVLGWICPLPADAWTITPSDPATAPARWRSQVQGAIIRYTIAVVTVYALGIACNLILGAESPESRIVVVFWAGVAIFAASLVGMVLFLRTDAAKYRERDREGRILNRPRGSEEWWHVLLTIGLGVGVALVGLRSAVFQVFIVLAVFAIITIIIARFSDTWNWPLAAFPLRVLIPILLVLLLWWTNSSPSKLRIPGLEDRYGHPTPIQPSLERAVKADPEDDRAVLDAWKVAARKGMPAGAGGKKANPKLAVLAVSGGANRAAFWTAAVLEKLDAGLPEFPTQLRLITGASGGMVGAGYYVAELYQPRPTAGPPAAGEPPARPNPGWLIEKIPSDSLSPVVRQWMLGDVPASFEPFDLTRAWDRGVILERAWPELRIPFGTLAGRELKGEIPSIVLSPMLIEDGRQLLISNLNLPFLTHAGGNLLYPRSDRYSLPSDPESNLYSFPSVEFFRLFPEERKTFELATAVRLNASFPYVSPALDLPTGPSRRVVDAGYYDNYGIAVAASWIFHHRKWLIENTSGVVLIQVRAYPNQVDRLELTEPTPSVFDGLSRAFQFATSPIEGGATSRDAATLFRNDQTLDALDKYFKDQGKPDFFTTALFENVLEVAMTWYTTDQELSLIKNGFGQDPAQAAEIARNIAKSPEEEARIRKGIEQNGKVFKMLDGWWRSH